MERTQSTEVIGIDHLYVTVSDLGRSEPFYDRLMRFLGFHKGDKRVADEPHAHYFNRVLQYTIRPAHDRDARHDAYAPGLHHLCFQVADRPAVDAAYAFLRSAGIEASEPALYPQYNDDYYATFFADPDGIRLEIVARSRYRKQLVEDWDELEDFLNPLAALAARRAAGR